MVLEPADGSLIPQIPDHGGDGRAPGRPILPGVSLRSPAYLCSTSPSNDLVKS